MYLYLSSHSPTSFSFLSLLLSTCKFIIFTVGKEAQLYLSQILRSTETGQGGKLGWNESSFLAP